MDPSSSMRFSSSSKTTPQTKIKSGPFLHGQLSVTSSLVHRPWQPGVITFLNLVALLSTPCPEHLSPRCPLVALLSQETHTDRPLCSASVSSLLLQDFMALSTLNTTQYMPIFSSSGTKDLRLALTSYLSPFTSFALLYFPGSNIPVSLSELEVCLNLIDEKLSLLFLWEQDGSSPLQPLCCCMFGHCSPPLDSGRMTVLLREDNPVPHWELQEDQELHSDTMQSKTPQ